MLWIVLTLMMLDRSGEGAGNNREERTMKDGKAENTVFVEYRGVEPLTYRLRTYRSSQLS